MKRLSLGFLMLFGCARTGPPPAQTTFPPSTQEDTDRDLGKRPVPPLGAADTAQPSADPEALKEAERQKALTSSTTAEHSSIVVGVVLLRPRSGSSMAGTGSLDQGREGAHLVLEVENAKRGSYAVELFTAPISCEDAARESEIERRTLGRLIVRGEGMTRFSAVIPWERGGQTVRGWQGRPLVLRPESGGPPLACGAIALARK